ncbi:MAG: ribonuclease Z [Clostridia bacterium]|nr:ribonuclease Z [Clostridia bacterium]
MLKFVGIGDLANVKYGNTCAYIKNESSLLILDCGVTAFQRIIELNLMDDIKDLYVAITHNHPDHVAGLASLIFYAHYWNNANVNIIVSSRDNNKQKDNLQKLLSIQGLKEKHYSFILEEDVNLFENSLTLKYEPVVHTSELECFAIILKTLERTIYYLGDNNDSEFIQNIVQNLGQNDIIYTDCTTYVYENKVHMELDTLVQIVPEKQRKQVCCMHLCNDESAKQIQAYGFKLASKEQSKKEILDKIRAH